MIKFEESKSFLVGIPATDSEHLELVSIINLINEYIKSTSTIQWVPGLIISFTRKLVEHFHSEELTLGEGANLHKAEHERIVSQAVNSLSDLSNINEETVLIFEKALKDHIINYDIPDLKNELQT